MENNQNNDSIILEEKVYTFRKLNAGDMPLMLSILKKININKFASCFQSEAVQAIISKNKDKENLDILAGGTIFLEVAQVIVSGLDECTDEIFKMLSNTSNLSVDEVKALGLDVFTEMVIDFIKKEEFKGFFKAVSALIR